jgi:hypothetical protein
VSWSPIASWISTAATAESTPPERPQITRVAHLGADFGDLGLAEFGHRPVAGAAADMTHEIGDQLAAVGRVDDFGMELGAVVLLFVIGDDGEGGAVGDRDDAETRGELGDLVTMAHPHLMALARCPEAVEEHARLGHGQEGAAKFARSPGSTVPPS